MGAFSGRQSEEPLTQISAGLRELAQEWSCHRAGADPSPALRFPLRSTEDHMSSMNAFVSTAEELQSARLACALAPVGPKKDAALIQLRAAERAEAAHRGADCLKLLSAAIAALD